MKVFITVIVVMHGTYSLGKAGKMKKLSVLLSLPAAIVVLFSSNGSAEILNIAGEITEHLWIQEYIPDCGEEIVPLSEYENYEVVELFEAKTVSDLEAALSDGYPMPWLEEALRDTTIPREDRYWLDCRIRSNYAQNLHCFADTDGTIYYLDADAVYPLELYWRENSVMDPAGWNAEGYSPRPVGAEDLDIGYILNRYGRRIGELPFPLAQSAMSRDGSLSVMSTGT
ncbi:hypothetical protein CSA37_02900, partial [Candidatus Fermentibacteria bacterium]